MVAVAWMAGCRLHASFEQAESSSKQWLPVLCSSQNMPVGSTSSSKRAADPA